MNLSRTTRPACPFVAGQKIEDPRCFVGREYELDYLATRMSGVQPVSVNVVGELLLGKSSLLWHFTRMRPWEQQVVDPARFVVAYTCLLQATPQTEVEFYQALAAALRKLPAVEQITPLRSTLAHFSGGSREFGDVLDVLAGQGILPVFCVDEFEMLLKRREQFGESFYDRLRGFMNASQLMFVLSSRKTLKVCGEELQLKSAFFNMGQVCKLKDFSEAETEKLLLLPDPLMPALEPEERVLARKWGGRHPHRLQQAARYVCLTRGDTAKATLGQSSSLQCKAVRSSRSACGNARWVWCCGAAATCLTRWLMIQRNARKCWSISFCRWPRLSDCLFCWYSG